MKIRRKIIQIDEDLCDGCGLCTDACAEGAIQIIDGKAKLINEIYCDGLGACLGDCPTGALTIEEREASAFDEKAVDEHLDRLKSDPAPAPDLHHAHHHGFAGCPGSAMRTMTPESPSPEADTKPGLMPSQLGHWPVQLMLVGPGAPFLQGADILVCADCVPFTVPDFHARYLKGKAVLVGCPKLDDLDHYRAKLKEIFAAAHPASLTVLRMEVPCCGGITHAALEARDAVQPDLPVTVHTIGIRGDIREETVEGDQKAVAGGLL